MSISTKTPPPRDSFAVKQAEQIQNQIGQELTTARQELQDALACDAERTRPNRTLLASYLKHGTEADTAPLGPSDRVIRATRRVRELERIYSEARREADEAQANAAREFVRSVLPQRREVLAVFAQALEPVRVAANKAIAFHTELAKAGADLYGWPLKGAAIEQVVEAINQWMQQYAEDRFEYPD